MRRRQRRVRSLMAAVREYMPARISGGRWGLDSFTVAAMDSSAILPRFLGPDGRLVSIPRKRAKLLVVLDRLAQEFELGRTYQEREVVVVLTRFHDDHAALRRYLVDEQFLSREHSVYWRTGGTVHLDDV